MLVIVKERKGGEKARANSDLTHTELLGASVELTKDMEDGDNSDEPNAHDEDSVGGYLAPCGLIRVELEHRAGTPCSPTATCRPPPPQTCGSRSASPRWCFPICHHLDRLCA